MEVVVFGVSSIFVFRLSVYYFFVVVNMGFFNSILLGAVSEFFCVIYIGRICKGLY